MQKLSEKNSTLITNWINTRLIDTVNKQSITPVGKRISTEYLAIYTPKSCKMKHKWRSIPNIDSRIYSIFTIILSDEM